MLIILKVLILMKFYNSVKYVYKCMCFGNASNHIPVLDTGNGCYRASPCVAGMNCLDLYCLNTSKGA